jgi:branched-chain amino acid transport system permease protein
LSDGRYVPVAALGAAIALGALAIGKNPVWLDTATVIAIYGLLALSVGLSYGQAGILSVAQASFASLGAYATAILSARYGWSPYATLPVSVLLPALVAYPLAVVVTRLQPLALAIATLVFGQALDLGLRQGGELTGGYIGISGIPPVSIAPTPFAYNLMCWGVVLLVVVLYSNLLHSPYGRALRTIRTDALRATADGVNVAHLRSATLALSAGMAGTAGWLYAHQISYVGPDSLTTSLSLSVLLMGVVGGVRTLLGPLLGAAVVTLMFKFLPYQEMQGMFFGAGLIAVLLLAPNGLLGLQWGRMKAAA